METTESMESLGYCFPLNNYKESGSFALACWQNVCLSDIWIPANLLSTEKKSSNPQQINHGVYHTLQKEEDTKCTESFSVYYDTEELQEEIFQSDSDEEILFSSENNSCEASINNITLLAKNKSSETNISSYSNSEKNTTDYKLYENVGSSKMKYLKSNENVNASKIEHLEFNENVSNDLSIGNKTTSCNVYENEENNSAKSTSNQSVNEDQNLTDSQISLNEILDKTPDINLKQFSFEFKKQDALELTAKLDKKTDLNIKRINKKERQLKKKAYKKIALDELPQCEVYEDDCANPFYQSIMRQKELANYSAEERNDIEFPKLVVEEDKLLISESTKFMKFDKPHNEEISDSGLQSAFDVTENTAKTGKEEIKIQFEEKTILGKMVIENIPFDVTEENIHDILFGYGEIKNFSLKPDGKFLKAFVEMDLICDIAWIVDCLNGADPFGASSETLKCYIVTDSCS